MVTGSSTDKTIQHRMRNSTKSVSPLQKARLPVGILPESSQQCVLVSQIWGSLPNPSVWGNGSAPVEPERCQVCICARHLAIPSHLIMHTHNPRKKEICQNCLGEKGEALKCPCHTHRDNPPDLTRVLPLITVSMDITSSLTA